ncbi:MULTISPECIES: 4Fe-4S binding protein [Sporomusa]|jgi:anaerobic sulfite reductase subunit C|uniref:Anaerobic sulfite reductase subunit C n=1 Tax=Sporomusa sphaeroides DSM 2875 TaxID=1337886 RepID=A0ABP2C859_9FIRM|nr:4Fe-4S binding protein [Sporomusa sphaeroides]OLS55159.1 anaerobic sulfite reductase subunit C [Sporomusa sphaeroides DSM 2875]CVK20503.1 Anaerobic sulfite reductase subunit C [Sporomusa sphaeroides DSM 2875]HML32266.1 4Fe-4S binding protein [Sporomusa sphaeroides]
MAQVDYKALKKGGFMRQIQKDRFSLRLRIVGGQIKAGQLKKVYEIAEQYGQGYVHMTSRQSIEIPFVKLEDIEVIKKELHEAGLQPGACGPRVRTITACQGSAVCPSGNIDTAALAQEFDKRYYARELPHKFKLGITGCSNNCLKAEENDLGVKGGILPIWQDSKCTFCGLCEAVCPAKAIAVAKEERKLEFKQAACTYCGKCNKSCPVDAWDGKSGFIVSFGGLFGNRIAIGKQTIPIVFEEDKLHVIVETALQFFADNGKPSERFRNTLDRVGWDAFQIKLKEVL